MTPTVLIIEDDGILATHLKTSVLELGYAVLGPVATGEAALAMIQDNQVHLVLVDIELAGKLNGIETAGHITRTSDVPIIFLTAFSQDHLLEQVKSIKPYGYLVKPVGERELAATISMSLHRHSLDCQLRQSRTALEQSEKRYRRLYEGAPIGIFRTTLPGLILMMNQEMARIIGCASVEEALASYKDLENQFWVSAQQRRDFINQLRKTGMAKQFECRARKKNGEIIWLSMDARLAPPTEANGHSPELIIEGFATDITQRKQAEKALRDSEQKTSNAKKLLELVLDTIPVRLFWKDRNLKFLGCNRLFAQDAGHQHPDELIGADDFSMAWNEQAEMYRQDDLEVMRTEQAKLQYEEIQTTPDGRTIWLSTSKVPLRDAQENVIGILGSYEDITQRKWAEEQLKVANEDLERNVEQRTLELQETQKQVLHAEKLAAIGKLSASIAHEFNNPLQGILSILKGLRKRAVLEDEDRYLLEAAITEGDRIRDLIRHLQDFNRPSSGRKAMMDVHKSLNSILLLHKNDFKSKRITVVLNYAEQLPTILAVPDQIKQVFLNLLTNAADACQQPGGVITVRTWQEEDRIAVAIHDTGIGIKTEELELLFQPFYTTKPEVKGTGLGLSVSYGIVNRHQGEIRVTSQADEGTTFTVVLPIKGEGVASINGCPSAVAENSPQNSDRAGESA
ncbi:ATP-binding protein [Desulfobulbus alkaliphilus]|uniref:ATP-binding protein n=1 Tax=Desulfobulbus alkaliphilus TaxID=869814 RepID=UPI00196515A3|nr:ATP-binding protein [Desulfobulbus alkaliphilus]MBM9536321.1 PAS domain S-box protein [Desulfobulbus alkaliphilus]